MDLIGCNSQFFSARGSALRDKLEDNAAQPKFIITEPAIGYRATGLE
jgi:hypothetical protein